MIVAAPRKSKKKYKISHKKVLYTGSFLLFLIIVTPWAFNSLKLFARYGFNLSRTLQHDNLLNFGIEIPRGYLIHGIDISHHQKNIQWDEVAAIDAKGIKIRFAFIKATEGITRQDRHFKRNWEKSKESGLIRGAYHFYYPSRDAKKQAENFIKEVELTSGDMPPVLDIEVSKGKSKAEIVKGCKEWCEIIEKHYKVKPIIYTNPSFYDKYLKDDFADYPLWIAHYYKDSPRMHHRDWIFWQHSDCASIKGIDKPVDFNVFKGSVDDLMNLCIQ
jgi:lysozyme